MSKIKNVKVGELRLKDVLEDIKSKCEYNGDYQLERNDMVERIDYYLDLIK